MILEVSDISGFWLSAKVSYYDGHDNDFCYLEFNQAPIHNGIAMTHYTDLWGNSGEAMLILQQGSISLHINERNHVSGDEFGYIRLNGPFTR